MPAAPEDEALKKGRDVDFKVDGTPKVSASTAGDIAWSPSAERIADARITEINDRLQATGRFEAHTYQSLWAPVRRSSGHP